jgi:hypothetical protein
LTANEIKETSIYGNETDTKINKIANGIKATANEMDHQETSTTFVWSVPSPASSTK